MLKNIVLFIIFALLAFLVGFEAKNLYGSVTKTSHPRGVIKIDKPLDKYTIENLSKTEFKPSEIKINENLFEFEINGKKVTGCINTPEGEGPFPVIVMFRGYVDQKQYKTCDGTKRAGEFFSKNGYITLAPDFLGYGGGDKEAENIFESRFQTYTTAATLIKSVKAIKPLNTINWDQKNIYIWGHSNGGQIAITVNEILQTSYPTVLWAPVTKPFPYSILYYTDESDDHGKLIRRELAKFEDLYDTDKYSLTENLDRINAPILLLQGTADDAVPVSWSDDFVKQMKKLDKDITYKVYSGADHNLNPSWTSAVNESLKFYQQKTKPTF